MIPLNEDLEELEDSPGYEEDETSKTYRMNLDKNNITGYTDNLEAIQQAVFKILNTERSENMVYTDDYGVELENLFGMPISYVYPELKRRIEEALTQDDRIESVDEFDFDKAGGIVSCSFIVHSIYGDFEETKEVSV